MSSGEVAITRLLGPGQRFTAMRRAVNNHAVDRSAALDAFAAHLAQAHRASGGHVRRIR